MRWRHPLVAHYHYTISFFAATAILLDSPSSLSSCSSIQLFSCTQIEWSSPSPITTHDFLSMQPVKGADVYFFRFIFHNWRDPYCVRILQALMPALKPGAQILINDTALPELGEMSSLEERTLRHLDMTMLTLLNARERKIAEFRMLFEMADKRFKWVGASLPPKSKMWKIEAVWDPEA